MTAKEVLVIAKERRTFTAEEMVAILRRRLLDGVAVSDLCGEHGLNPKVFCLRQTVFFENATAAFDRREDGSARERKLAQKVEALAAKLARKDEVIGEIMAGQVRQRKVLGGPERRMGGAGPARRGVRLRARVVGEDGDSRNAAGPGPRPEPEQVLRLETAVRPGERAQRLTPRDHWLEDREKEAIIACHLDHRDDG